MTYSTNRDEKLLRDMIEHYGSNNIPNPEHNPIQFEFLALSFEHHVRMKSRKMSANQVDVL